MTLPQKTEGRWGGVLVELYPIKQKLPFIEVSGIIFNSCPFSSLLKQYCPVCSPHQCNKVSVHGQIGFLLMEFKQSKIRQMYEAY